MGNKLTQIDVDAFLSTRSLRQLSPYVGLKTPLLIECSSSPAGSDQVCGFQGHVVPEKVRYGIWRCPVCLSGQPSRLASRHEGAFKEMQRFGFTPREGIKYPGANEPWTSTCQKCGKETAPALSNLRLNQGGCGHCARNAPLTDIEVNKRISHLGLSLDGPFATARTLAWYRCHTCMKRQKRRYDDVRKSFGCTYCNSKTMTQAELKELGRLRRLIIVGTMVSTTKPVQAICVGPVCKREREEESLRRKKLGLKPVSPKTINVIPHFLRKQGGCSHCAGGGLDYTKATILYLARHSSKNGYKVGITNVDANPPRQVTLGRFGFDYIQTWWFPNGWGARKAESKVKNWLFKELKLEHSHSKAEMSGWSETFTCTVRIAAVKSKITVLHKSLGGLPESGEGVAARTSSVQKCEELIRKYSNGERVAALAQWSGWPAAKVRTTLKIEGIYSPGRDRRVAR